MSSQGLTPPVCWIITEGMAGTENQCIGVAEALSLTPVVKRVTLREPWKSLSPLLGFEQAWSFDPELKGPWPDILIASGRKSVAASRYIKKQSGGKTFTVQIQDPRVPSSNFDLVAVPAHDPMRGDNVIVTLGAPNRITKEKLEDARKRFPQFEKIRGPRIAVLIGGTSKAYDMTPEITHGLAQKLKTLPGGLMVTASRRTGEANRAILEQALKDTDAYIWNGTDDNPYGGFLAWADVILVTADSTSMLSEAATTGKPVYIIGLEGGAKRLDLMHKNMVDVGIARFFDGKLESWTYPPLNDARKVATEITRRWKGAAG